jgi:hypothetical protein
VENVIMKKEKKKVSLEQVELERELWNAALRVPPPRTPKTKYSRKGKSRFNSFDNED